MRLSRLAVLPLLAVLCGMVSGPPATSTLICSCSTSFRGFTLSTGCSGSCTSSNVTDTLSCTGNGWAPCPISGSIQVTYQTCTLDVCVMEEYAGCTASANCVTYPAEGWRSVSNGGYAEPTTNACCEPSGLCTYEMKVEFISTGTCGRPAARGR